MEFWAHWRETKFGIQVHTAADHCRGTAIRAGKCLAPAGLSQAAALAGLVHDCGKFKEEFMHYLTDPQGIRGSVNHTFSGFRLLMERYHGSDLTELQALSAELLALAVGGHHGLFDCVDPSGESGMVHRMTKPDIHHQESCRNFLSQCAGEDELDQHFSKAHRELLEVYEKITGLTRDPWEVSFHLGLLSRLLLSAVIQGDRQDTAEFMGGISPPPREVSSDFWGPYLQRMEKKLALFPQNTPISKARAEISDRCGRFANNPGGVYRLNVPTGAGKTLSSLRYALAHAHKWHKRRLIFASPLLSILEQNAAVLRTYIDDDSIILEHHSNIVQTQEQGELDLRELAQESWDAPVIITTLVQLLNTLFDGRTTSIRRFQSLCGSVIVIDEVQTVPCEMLSMFNGAVDFLARVCDATVLLCSATQPCLEETVHPLRSPVADLIPQTPALWEPFQRTRIVDAGPHTLEQIGAFALESLSQVQSLLVVCNNKDEAEQLFELLHSHADFGCHLSASMCTAHRRNTLKELEQTLSSGQKCLCVATQVIEAGVDISFERVIRLSAGMDSVIQAAGRCNRHGKQKGAVPVYVVPCLGEKLGMLKQIRSAKQATDALLDAYRRNPDRFDGSLSSGKAIDWYYRTLYQSMPPDYQDYPLDKSSLYELLSRNVDFLGTSPPSHCMTQAFHTAGSKFQVFDSDTRDVVVPYGEGEKLIEELAGQATTDPGYLSRWLRQAKPYIISVYDWQLRALGNGAAEYHGVVVLRPEHYNEFTGFRLRADNAAFLEV